MSSKKSSDKSQAAPKPAAKQATAPQNQSAARGAGLAAALAMFDSPAPQSDFDPESPLFNNDDSDSGNDGSDGDDQDEELDRSHYVSVGTSALRKQLAPELEGPRYAGKKVSRKELQMSESDEDDQDESVDDESGEEDDVNGMDVDSGLISGSGSDDAADEEKESDVEREASPNGDAFSWGAADGLDADSDEAMDASDMSEPEAFGNGASGDSESGSEDDDEEGDDSEQAASDELTRKMLQAAAESEGPASDADKGKHIKAQMDICDSLLDLRIRLQKAVTLANTLPAPSEYPEFLKLASSENVQLADSIAQTRQVLADLSSDLSRAHRQLANMNPVLSPVVAATVPRLGKRKRDEVESEEGTEEEQDWVDQLWADTVEFTDKARTWRMTALEKWHDKVNATAGIQLNVTKKFKAINTSFSSQVETVLRDRERLLKRTHLKRSNDAILTLHPETDESNGAAAGATAAGQISGQERQLVDELDESMESRSSARQLRNATLDYIYDDSDFYASLLKDLIDRKLSSGGAGQGQAIAQHHATLRASRVKRKVDTRASKGRKLRFHVHEKLANYMAPTAGGVMPQYNPMNVPGSAIVGGTGGAMSNADEGGNRVSRVVPWSESMMDELFGSLFGFKDERLVKEAAERKSKEEQELSRKQKEVGKLRMFG